MPWISAFEPTSTPTVGPFSTSTRGPRASQRASTTRCWLPPDSERTGAPGSGGLHRQPPQPLLRLAPEPGEIEERPPRVRLHPPDPDVPQDRLGQEQPLGQPVLRDVADARRRRSDRVAERNRPPVERHAPRVGRHQPEERLGERRPPRPEQPRDPEHLAGMQVEPDVVRRRPPSTAPAPPAVAPPLRQAAPAASRPRPARSCGGSATRRRTPPPAPRPPSARSAAPPRARRPPAPPRACG